MINRRSGVLIASLFVSGIAVPALLLASLQRSPTRAFLPPAVSSLPPLKCRDDLAARAQALDLTGLAAEIGVRDGLFAKHNLAAWNGRRYYMIDAWSHRPPEIEVGLQDATLDDMNEPQERSHLARMEQARLNTQQWSSRREMVRAFSTVASTQFQHDQFDWVYIDALHTYEAVKRDLEAWWPLVRPGGMMSGDDFVDYSDAKMVEWNGALPVKFSWGTRRAVTEFFRAVGSPIRVTYMYDCYNYPAWYVRKAIGKPSLNDQRLSKAQTHPLKCREDLPALARELGLGATAQVGDTMVGKHGAPQLELDMISTKLKPAHAKAETEENATHSWAPATKPAGAGRNRTWSWLHLTSQDDHTHAGVMAQLTYWWPKLRSGGMMSGDDFVNGTDHRWTDATAGNPQLLAGNFPKARDIFNKCDEDGSGDIDVGELRALVQSLGQKVPQSTLDATVLQVDVNGDRAIDFEEFLQLVSSLSRSAGWRKTASTRGLTPSDWNVEGAVNDFFFERGVEVYVSYALYCYPYPVWYVIKP